MPYELVEDQESLGGTLGRGLARTAARVGESVVGLPGDVVAGVAGLGNIASQALGGGEIPLLTAAQQNPFTSRSIKENITEKLTGDYLKPQGGTEEFLDEVVGDLASMLVPGGIASKGASLTAKGIAKTGAKALAGATAKAAVTSATDSELAGNIAKFTTLSLANTIGGRSALTKQMNQRYEAADKSIHANKVIRAEGLKKSLDSDIKILNKGVHPEKQQILGVLNGVKNNFNKQGNIKVRDVWNLKKDINQYLKDPKLDSSVRGSLKKTIGELNGVLGDYAKTNPEFANNFYPAEEIYSAINKGSTINKALQNNVTFKKAMDKFTPISTIGFGLMHFGGVTPAKIAAGFAAGVGVRELVKMGEFLARSPIARKHYVSLLKAAQAGNGAIAAREIQKLDALAAKEEGTQAQGRYELVG